MVARDKKFLAYVALAIFISMLSLFAFKDMLVIDFKEVEDSAKKLEVASQKIHAEFLLEGAGVGEVSAQENVATLYEQGRGFPQSYQKAYYWLSIASEHGSATAGFRLEKVAKHLTPAEISEIKKRAKVWKPIPVPHQRKLD